MISCPQRLRHVTSLRTGILSKLQIVLPLQKRHPSSSSVLHKRYPSSSIENRGEQNNLSSQLPRKHDFIHFRDRGGTATRRAKSEGAHVGTEEDEEGHVRFAASVSIAALVINHVYSEMRNKDAAESAAEDASRVSLDSQESKGIFALPSTNQGAAEPELSSAAAQKIEIVKDPAASPLPVETVANFSASSSPDNGPTPAAVPGPDADQVLSLGSIGHPKDCKGPCRRFQRQGYCEDGDRCRACHVKDCKGPRKPGKQERDRKKNKK